jgi:hypothetical protein
VEAVLVVITVAETVAAAVAAAGSVMVAEAVVIPSPEAAAAH